MALVERAADSLPCGAKPGDAPTALEGVAETPPPLRFNSVSRSMQASDASIGSALPMRHLYSLLLHLALPWVWARLHWRARTESGYGERVGERFGNTPPLPAGAVWFHTVSAGETNAAAPIIQAVQERLPERPVLVTTMTPTGSERVRTLLSDIAHCYAPYDYPWAVRRFLQRAAPACLVLMETELWPNLIRRTARRGAPVFLVNARLSERSYRRYRRVSPLLRETLQHVRGVLCQYDDTATRFRSLGARQVQVTGSVKFDAELAPDPFGVADPGFGGAPTWIAGSTHAGEEEVILDAHRMLLAQYPAMRLILVPRHPARAPQVQQLVRQRGFASGLASERAQGAQVLIGDVMGTLAHLYAYADVAFVGGSLDRTGGHNPIEAASHGLPILMGTATFKIDEIRARFAAEGCLHVVTDAADIERTVAALIADPERRRQQGERAKAVVQRNRGAQQRVVDELCRWIGEL